MPFTKAGATVLFFALAILAPSLASAQPNIRERQSRYHMGSSSDLSLLRILPAYQLPSASGGCDGVAVTGMAPNGSTVTVSTARASSAGCTKGDGTFAWVGSNLSRVNSFGIHGEGTGVTLVLYGRDWSNAVWTKSNASCALDATGADGAANGASTCTASAGNATILQSLTVAAAVRATSFRVKGVTLTGALYLTRDGDSTRATLSSSNCFDPGTYVATAPNTSTFVRCWVASSVLNPVVGLKIQNSGDSVVVDLAVDENSATPTTEYVATATSVTRATEKNSFSTPATVSDSAGCGAARVYVPFTTGPNRIISWTLNNTPIYLNTSAVTASMWDGTGGTFATIPTVVGRSVDLRGFWSGVSMTSGEIGGASNTSAYDLAIKGATTYLGTDDTGARPLGGFISNVRFGATTTACEN